MENAKLLERIMNIFINCH